MPQLVFQKSTQKERDNRVRVTQDTMDIITEFANMTHQPKILIVEKMVKFAAEHAIIEETVSYKVRLE